MIAGVALHRDLQRGRVVRRGGPVRRGLDVGGRHDALAVELDRDGAVARQGPQGGRPGAGPRDVPSVHGRDDVAAPEAGREHLALDAHHRDQLAGHRGGHLAAQRAPEGDRVGVEEPARRGQPEGEGLLERRGRAVLGVGRPHPHLVRAREQLVAGAVGRLHAHVGAAGGPVGGVGGGLDHLAVRREHLDRELRGRRQLRRPTRKRAWPCWAETALGIRRDVRAGAGVVAGAGVEVAGGAVVAGAVVAGAADRGSGGAERDGDRHRRCHCAKHAGHPSSGLQGVLGREVPRHRRRRA